MTSAPTPGPARFVFDDGAAYEAAMGRWSALVAEPFLDWLALPDGLCWLDDGCGDGSFTEALVLRQKPASVVGVDPEPAQLAFARQRMATAGVRFVEGDAQALPLPDESVDAAVMALVLFFLPDPRAGVRELARVVRPGGTVAAYHWDMAGGGLPLQPIIDAVRAEGHGTQQPPSSWASAMEASEGLWRDAGLVDVQTRPFEVRRTFGSFEDYWQTAYASTWLRDLFTSMPSRALQRLVDRVRDQVAAVDGGSVVTTARAHAVKGRRR